MLVASIAKWVSGAALSSNGAGDDDRDDDRDDDHTTTKKTKTKTKDKDKVAGRSGGGGGGGGGGGDGVYDGFSLPASGDSLISWGGAAAGASETKTNSCSIPPPYTHTHIYTHTHTDTHRHTQTYPHIPLNPPTAHPRHPVTTNTPNPLFFPHPPFPSDH